MFRLIGIAVAAAVGAWWFLRKKPDAAGPRSSKTDTTIVVGGSGKKPHISQQPDTLEARKGEQLTWAITNETDGTQEVGLRGFHRDNNPAKEKLLKDQNVIVAPGRTEEIRVRIAGDAKKGTYKYSIDLNGAEAVDPDVVIYEGA